MVSKNDLPEALSQILTSEGQNLAFSAKNGEKPQFSLFGSLRKAGFPSGKMAGNGEKSTLFDFFRVPGFGSKMGWCTNCSPSRQKGRFGVTKPRPKMAKNVGFFRFFRGIFRQEIEPFFPIFA
jgi:hypothetical protein